MNMKKLFSHLLSAAVTIALSCAAFADGAGYVTGAECEVSNQWLIVKSGIGTITNQFKVTGYDATRIRIEEGVLGAVEGGRSVCVCVCVWCKTAPLPLVMQRIPGQ